MLCKLSDASNSQCLYCFNETWQNDNQPMQVDDKTPHIPPTTTTAILPSEQPTVSVHDTHMPIQIETKEKRPSQSAPVQCGRSSPVVSSNQVIPNTVDTIAKIIVVNEVIIIIIIIRKYPNSNNNRINNFNCTFFAKKKFLIIPIKKNTQKCKNSNNSFMSLF
jgi:hypothetical protein